MLYKKVHQLLLQLLQVTCTEISKVEECRHIVLHYKQKIQVELIQLSKLEYNFSEKYQIYQISSHHTNKMNHFFCFNIFGGYIM